MAKHPDDDLFAQSTMSFGDHLEELRVALFRSVIGLMAGMALGLLVANQVVQWIKEPLQSSLEKYYVEKSLDQLKAANEGKDVPKPLKDFITGNRLVSDIQYVEAAEVARLERLRQEYLKMPAARQRDDAPPAETAATGSPALQLTSTTDASAARAAELEGPIILGDESLPPPSNIMMVTRVWRPIHSVVKALSAHEVFMIWMKAGLVVGAVLASPYIFYQIWNFVAAGLYPHEKRYVYVYMPFSIGLFLTGAALCFFYVIPEVLKWLFSFNKALNIDPDPRINEWMGFVLFLPLGFGISFQLPLVMLLLNRIGIFSIEQYLAKWRIAVLVIFVISMVLTPADPVSMLFMAIPLTFLYFGGIGLCRYMPRGRNPFDEAYEPGA